MSFSKSKLKRFPDTVSHAPPVGSYNVTSDSDKGTGPVTFDHGSRFTEKKDQTPGPADTQPDLVATLNSSNASINSTGLFATPSKPIRRNTRQKSSSVTDISCKDPISNQINHLQYKICELEKNLQRSAKEKATAERNLKMACIEKDKILIQLEEAQADGGMTVQQIEAELESCRMEMSLLKKENIDLGCEKGNLEADLELGKRNEDALKEQISYMELVKAGLINQIAELNGTIIQLQDILDQVRYDKRISDEDVVNLKSQLKENQATFAAVKLQYEEGQEEISRIKQELESHRDQRETVQMNLAQLEQRFEEICKERQSFQDNCFNLERAKELLEDQRSQLTEDLDRIRNEKEQAEEQLKTLEDTTTESLRDITHKYEALEDSNATMKEEFESREVMLRSELEVTKQSYEGVKSDLDVMKSTYAVLRQDYDALVVDSDELGKKLEEAESTQLKIKAENKDLSLVIDNNCHEYEKEKQAMFAKIEGLKGELQSKEVKLVDQEEEISNLRRSISDAEEESELLYRQLDRANRDLDKKKEDIMELESEMQKSLSIKEESISRITEELGRRIIETQTKLARSEHEFKSLLEREQKKYSELFQEYNRLQSGKTIEDLKRGSDMWQSKFEELEAKVRPFQTQLELFEQEKFALMSENNWKESEIAKLAERYAQILGHQNNKQKIHHIVKIKEENLSLKKEVSKLRSQLNREKFSKNNKANSPKVARKSRFDPANAFQHGGKENEVIKPLAELKDGDLNSTINW